VAIPEGELAEKAAELQREFSMLYGIYIEPYPPLHLTIAVISFPPSKLTTVEPELASAVRTSLPLKLASEGYSCFPEPYKSINLSITRSGDLTELSSKVITLIGEIGCSADKLESWDYHISLVNRNYAAREWTEAEYEEACRRLSQKQLIYTGEANRLELWDPEFPPLKVLAAFSADS